MAAVLIENVTHHIAEEEQDSFPQARAGCLARGPGRSYGAGGAEPGAASAAASAITWLACRAVSLGTGSAPGMFLAPGAGEGGG